MENKKTYTVPGMRTAPLYLEKRILVATATVGGVTPGNNPGQGGSWDFGEDDN